MPSFAAPLPWLVSRFQTMSSSMRKRHNKVLPVATFIICAGVSEPISVAVSSAHAQGGYRACSLVAAHQALRQHQVGQVGFADLGEDLFRAHQVLQGGAGVGGVARCETDCRLQKWAVTSGQFRRLSPDCSPCRVRQIPTWADSREGTHGGRRRHLGLSCGCPIPSRDRHHVQTARRPGAGRCCSPARHRVSAQPAARGRTTAAYPPFSELGPDGKLTGFDIDIAAGRLRPAEDALRLPFRPSSTP